MLIKLILALILALAAVVLIRTLRFKPLPEKPRDPRPVEFDGDAAVNALAELVRCKTVSYDDPSLEDDAEFDKLIAKLPELYPHVCDVCSMQRFDGRGLLLRWKGKDSSGEPAVLMAHYDVVPVEEDLWTRPAFEALIEDGIMWGRGTVDTKNSFNGIMSAAEELIKRGFTPQSDIYFAFSGGEEIGSEGAPNIVRYFAEQGITPSLVLDEGGAVVEGLFPGVDVPCGMVGIAEKGQMNITYRFTGDGGHASSPAPHTPVGRLAAACVRVENKPYKYHLTKPVLEMFDCLGRRSTFAYRMIFANLWLFGGLLDSICRKSGGALNALVRTTVAFTKMEGSKASNVIPPTASMSANLRLNPEDSVESALAYMKSVVNDPEIELIVDGAGEPTPISRTDCRGWEIISGAVADTWNCVVSPYLMVQCSDSRHYSAISDRVYKFSAADLTADERDSIHGNDEHIRIETVKRAVEFFIRLMLEC